MKRLGTERKLHSISGLCKLFGVSKQAYYKQPVEDLRELMLPGFAVEYVESVREKNPRLGGEKLWHIYQSYFGADYSVGRDKFLGILRDNNLLLRKHRKRCRTTDSGHDYPLYPNLIKSLIPTCGNQVWVSDITYIRLLDDFCFLSIITDAYTHQVIGYCVGPTLEAVYTLKAFAQASNRISHIPKEKLNLIHHSDRGSQYASYLYTHALKERGIQISMTENGDPKENAIAERINGILKQEFLNHYSFSSIEHVREVVEGSISFYNNERPHRSLDMMTPNEAQGKEGRIKKRWISHRENYITNQSKNSSM